MPKDQINIFIDKCFYSAAKRHEWDITNPDVKEAFRIGFFEGSKYTVRTTAELTPYVNRFAEFVMWVMDGQQDYEQVQEELPF